MTLKYSFKNVLVLFMAMALFVSCKDDSESSKIELLSFGPTGVKHGDKIKFIGENMDKVTSIILPSNVEVTSFASQNSTVIELVVPDAAEPGKVLLKTPQGDIESKTALNFLVPVEITSITAAAKPGTNITIKGKLVNWIESVTFNDGLKVTDVVSKSLTELVVTVPMTAKTGYLTFQSGGTKPTSFTSTDPLTVSLPIATALNPVAVKHAENLTITGANLDLVTKITFPGGTTVSSSAFVSQSATQIVVTVPVNAVDGKLVLTAPSGVTGETSAISIVLPAAATLSSNQSPGATLTITGTNLDLVGKIKFPGVANAVTSFVSKSSTKIEVVIPSGTQGGTLVLITIREYSVPVSLPFGDQLTLAQTIYDDAIKTPFGKGGGWGTTTTDVANSENIRLGTKAVKVTYGGDWGGACQFGTWGNSPLAVSGSSYFAFSIYGGTGTGGKNINVNVSGKQVQIAVEEGKWKDVKIALTDVGSPASISEVWFQDTGWSGTVYIDQVGLK